MQLIEYQEKYRDLMAEMLVSFQIKHLDLLGKSYDREVLLEESLASIPEFNAGKHHLYLGLEDQTIVGFMVLDYRGSEVCWIDDLFVLEDKRNRGYGSAMIKLAFELVEKQGYEGISIDVVPRNKEAIRLYLKLGFDSLSILTLRHEFRENKRDQEIELWDYKLKY